MSVRKKNPKTPQCALLLRLLHQICIKLQCASELATVCGNVRVLLRDNVLSRTVSLPFSCLSN